MLQFKLLTYPDLRKAGRTRGTLEVVKLILIIVRIRDLIDFLGCSFLISLNKEMI